MWILYFVIGFSTILTINNNYQTMQYLCVGHKSWSNVNTRIQVYHLLTQGVKYDYNGC